MWRVNHTRTPVALDLPLQRRECHRFVQCPDVERLRGSCRSEEMTLAIEAKASVFFAEWPVPPRKAVHN